MSYRGHVEKNSDENNTVRRYRARGLQLNVLPRYTSFRACAQDVKKLDYDEDETDLKSLEAAVTETHHHGNNDDDDDDDDEREEDAPGDVDGESDADAAAGQRKRSVNDSRAFVGRPARARQRQTTSQLDDNDSIYLFVHRVGKMSSNHLLTYLDYLVRVIANSIRYF